MVCLRYAEGLLAWAGVLKALTELRVGYEVVNVHSNAHASVKTNQIELKITNQISQIIMRTTTIILVS